MMNYQYPYLNATGLCIDDISVKEMADFARAQRKMRERIIEDLLQKLTKYGDLNNPVSYNKLYRDLIDFKESLESSIEELLNKKEKTMSADGHNEIIKLIDNNEFFEEEDERMLEEYQITLQHLKKRIANLQLLFDKYVETDWSSDYGVYRSSSCIY